MVKRSSRGVMDSAARNAIIGRLDLELLMALVAIVDAGSFKQAARRLNLTQSAISMQIKRLEDRVGQRLLSRHGRQVELTEAGRILHKYARTIVDLEEEARMQLAMPPLSGRVRIGLPEWFAGRRLQALLAQFTRAHPGVHLAMRADASSELREAVSAGTLDLALGIIESVDNAPPAVYQEQLVWVVGEERALEINEDMPVALFDPPCPYRELAMEGLERCGWRGHEVFTSASVASVRTAVETGLGISVFPESAVRPGLRVLTNAEGFPELPMTTLGIYKSSRISDTPADHLCSYLEKALCDGGYLPPP
ncbi:LysR family transcriptional regulator [Ferruginivarius sediminum]|uniref:LysR family transcriptional regulator n=2 Tax=Ferruginivarius sediminum TaxID=2661937 RepID=A0A369TBB9_9PROT|nr:LysR family transcriptional regulator [Ferruginivarius sediminum]